LTDTVPILAGFIVWPDDTVAEYPGNDRDNPVTGRLPGAYDELREAGVPINSTFPVSFPDVLDLIVWGDGTAAAYSGDEPRRQSMLFATVAPFLNRWNAWKSA